MYMTMGNSVNKMFLSTFDGLFCEAFVINLLLASLEITCFKQKSLCNYLYGQKRNMEGTLCE